jgi:hypothetical protein
MAFGDYWKVVSGEDFDTIQERIRNYWNENDEIDSEAIDWAYKLFGDKYGPEIRLVEKFEYDVLIDLETEEEYYIDENGERVYGDWASSICWGFRYIDSDFSDTTIEYVEVDNEQIWKQANNLAQNHWSYDSQLKPVSPWMSIDEYQEQLFQAGFE